MSCIILSLSALSPIDSLIVSTILVPPWLKAGIEKLNSIGEIPTTSVSDKLSILL